MSGPAVQEEQLLELMLQLRKTTPDQARAILNSQPQIAYALMAVMVNVNAVKVDVIQKTVADFTANQTATAQASSTPTPPPPATNAPAPITSRPLSSIPPPLRGPPSQAGPYARHGTPSGPPIPAPASYYGQPSSSYLPTPPTSHNSYGPGSGPPPMYGGPPPPGLPAGYQLPPAFANIPEEQKALLMNVIAMTPEDIYRRPAQERANLIQLRQTLGLPV
ncbi:hypothetical protein BDY19DRAFT_913155 [Irpex rosettiformis]|uniref:Uncharacterized protein n=1 Tax=Irpex rosettiformis TaxID=378272 RepID=A0ACB8UJN8_9APHY|nr:hypothetical protein BDY19DRAFT_913155 [Irpex rosettiformis]